MTELKRTREAAKRKFAFIYGVSNKWITERLYLVNFCNHLVLFIGGSNIFRVILCSPLTTYSPIGNVVVVTAVM